VRRGETLSRIAKRYGVTTGELARANRLSTKAKLRAGRVLRLPDGAEEPIAAAKPKSSKSKKGSSRKTAPAAPDGEYKYHVVRQGDSLWSISQQYGMTMAQLHEINDLGSRSVLRPGQKVKVR
jgi:LysM repeat protein